MSRLAESSSLTLHPIGVVRSPFVERSQAPRQPAAARGVQGSIELFPGSGIEHALEDLHAFRFIWVIFWFHLNEGFRPKALPPRSGRRRGVFATRSPYRPNPIGLSAVELLAVEGRTLRIQNLDLLDGTPVLDLKPYIAYTDAIVDAPGGWLEEGQAPDPIAEYSVELDAAARAQLDYLESAHGIELAGRVCEVLRLGPQPHPYRRIKQSGDALILAHKAWRFRFRVDGMRIVVTQVRSGYRPSILFTSDDPALSAHREFVARFGA